MGIHLREILESDFFIESKVLAGRKGLGRIVQGVSSQDAPTGGQWARGKELILSTGYFFKDNIEYFKEIIIEANKNDSAGIGIKVGRYLDEIPEEIIELCNSLDFPLIDLPKNAAWIEIANAINEIALDIHIEKLNNFIQIYGNKDRDRKVKEIIESLSLDIEKPVEVYDFCKNKIYSSSNRNIKNVPLDDYNYIWNPDSKHEKKSLSEKFDIFRIKSFENDRKNLRTVVPIEIDDIILAYLVVWENQERSDYYDLYIIRLSFILLLHEYGSMYFESSLKDKYQDELILQVINNEFENETKMVKRILDTNELYLCISIKQLNNKIDLYEHREKISRCIYRVFRRNEVVFGLIDKDEIVILYISDKSLNEIDNLVQAGLKEVIKGFEDEIQKSKFVAGVCGDLVNIKDIKNRYTESLQTINISKYIYPNSKVIFYDDLGPFKFINLEEFKEENMSIYTKYIEPLTLQEDGQDFILTLKTFLENNLNYSLASNKLFVHSNTVRYRINKIKNLVDIDFDDSMERLKLEIVLKFLKLFK